MADTGSVIITLRKPCADEAAARVILDVVKTKLTDQPDVVVSGHFTKHFDSSEE